MILCMKLFQKLKKIWYEVTGKIDLRRSNLSVEERIRDSLYYLKVKEEDEIGRSINYLANNLEFNSSDESFTVYKKVLQYTIDYQHNSILHLVCMKYILSLGLGRIQLFAKLPVSMITILLHILVNSMKTTEDFGNFYDISSTLSRVLEGIIHFIKYATRTSENLKTLRDFQKLSGCFIKEIKYESEKFPNITQDEKEENEIIIRSLEKNMKSLKSLKRKGFLSHTKSWTEFQAIKD